MSYTITGRFASGMLAFGLGAILAYGAAPPAPQGLITAKAFLSIGGGTAITDLTGNAKFTNNSPDFVSYLPYFEWNPSGTIGTVADNNFGDNYGDQIIGYFYPPVDGDYAFYVCSDDPSQLFLSTDDNPANKKLIAQEAGWSNPRNFTSIGGGSVVEDKCSQTFTNTQWPIKDPGTGGAKITLSKGKAYYIETLHKEGGGGDNCAVAVAAPDGSIDSSSPIPGQYLSSFDKNTGPASIVTQPQNVTVNEGQPATFSVVADGTPPFTYVWSKNGVQIPDPTTFDAAYPKLTNAPYTNIYFSTTINRAYRADNGAQIKVVVTGAQGLPVTSAVATLTVVNDTTPPTIVSAKALGAKGVIVTFSEPLDPASAQLPGNYTISGGVTVTAAQLGAIPGDNVVTLSTSEQPSGATLTLTVTGVKDVPGNLIAAGSQVTFTSLVFAPGILHKFWSNIGSLAALGTDSRFPDTPSLLTIEPLWEYPPNGGNEAGDNYGNQLTGWFTPPSTGDYVFFTCSDDQSDFFLSTDDNAANKKLIAQESGWSNPHTWITANSGDATLKRSDTCVNSQWPGGPGLIHLIGGQKYYMESRHYEGGGGDNVGATFINVTAGDADPVNGDAPRLTKSNVGFYLDPTGASVTIVTPPVAVTQQEQLTATFTVVATGTSVYGTAVSYQWQSAPKGSTTFTDISGATSASYTTPLLKLTDDGKQFRVVCASMVPTVTATSPAVTLTVIPDTFPPTVTAAGSLLHSNAVEIGVQFSENVDLTTASAAGNYTLSKGTVTGVRYLTYDHMLQDAYVVIGSTGPFNGGSVVLTTSGLNAGDTLNLTVNNVKDVKGNAMTSQTVPVTITRKMNRAQMGGHDYVEGWSGNPAGLNTDPALWPNDEVAYSESDFDLISSGSGNWNAYDECDFVYEKVTGDFDKVARVEYQDPTSAWARAGMCATPDPNDGMTHDQVANGGQLMEKRFMMRANPAMGAAGLAANHQYEYAWRDIAGGNYSGGGAGAPAFPNAWLRMQRTGGTNFTALWSNDGKNWYNYGYHAFAAEPMPDTLDVGPYYSPEMDNGTTTANTDVTGLVLGHSAVVKFRNYGDYTNAPSKATYAIGLQFGPDDNTGSFLPAMDTAGVLVQANWNNLPTLAGGPSPVVADALGVAKATTATVSWTGANTWSSTGSRGEYNNGFSGNDRILMTGYLDTGAASTTQVTVNGLPSNLTSQGYDVCVYLLGGYGGRGGGYRITDTAGTTLKDYVNAAYIANASEAPQGWVQVAPTAGSWAPGNFIVFSNLTASSIIVEATTENGHGYDAGGTTYRAPINAIQLAPKNSFITTQPPGKMTITLAAGSVTITWEGDGTLQSAPAVTGPWTDIGPAKPHTEAVSGAAKFFRVKGL